LYNLRNSAPYRAQRVVLTKTRPTKTATIGVRKAPAPDGRPGFIRIDSVHQGDWDGIKGVYHINAVDCVTQWEVVATVQTILPRPTCCPSSGRCSSSSPSRSWGSTPTTAASTSTTGSPRC
jgi:hypothetical protein